MTLYDFIQSASYVDDIELIELVPTEDGNDKIQLCEPKKPHEIYEELKDVLDYDVIYFYIEEAMKDNRNFSAYLRVYVKNFEDLRRQYNGK